MPEVIRGSRTRSFEQGPPTHPTTPSSPHAETPVSPFSHDRRVTFDRVESQASSRLTPVNSAQRAARGTRNSKSFERTRRKERASIERVEQDAYYDSRAATKREFQRRASTLQSYYHDHPYLLPQLPFTFRHGFKRWKLAGYIVLIIIDACVIPIVLYYTMTDVGHVQGFITFAIVATIWGGPTYVEFAVRSWRLIKKEHFFRPLGSTGRWHFDITHWILVLTIFIVTALLVVGSAPHIVFLRVLAMPAPGILYALSVPLIYITFLHMTGRKAPFRLSSTAKGEKVRPGIYYLIEDIVAVNAGGGRPFREGLAARYEASPIFQKMLRDQSLFWSIPAFLVAVGCTVVVCIHKVPNNVGYGIGWGVPFFWALIWAAITVPWVRHVMHKETVTWEEDNQGIVPSTKMTPGDIPVNGHALDGSATENGDIEKEGEGTVPQLQTPEPHHHPAHTTNNANERTTSDHSSGATAVAADSAPAVTSDHPEQIEKPSTDDPAVTSPVGEAKDGQLPPQSPTEQPKLEKMASEDIGPTDVVSGSREPGFATAPTSPLEGEGVSKEL